MMRSHKYGGDDRITERGWIAHKYGGLLLAKHTSSGKYANFLDRFWPFTLIIFKNKQQNH